jgi:hypothetical protein
MVKFVRNTRASRVLKGCLGGVGLLVGVLGYSYLDPVWCVLLISVFGTFTVLQVFGPILVHWRVYSRNPRLFSMRTVVFDDDGIKSDSELRRVEIKWGNVEKFKETPNLFLTYQTRDAVGIVPKRAFPNLEAVAQFRHFLSSKIRSA